MAKVSMKAAAAKTEKAVSTEKKAGTKASATGEKKNEAPVMKEATATKVKEDASMKEKEASPAKAKETATVKSAPATSAEGGKTAPKQEKKSEPKAATSSANKKTVSKAVSAKVSIQFAGKDYSTEKLVEIAKDVWQYDLGKKAADFKSVELYVKTEENTVYYVINNETTGSFTI